MSYEQQPQQYQQTARPGFSEAPGSFESGGFSQSTPAPQAQYQNSYASGNQAHAPSTQSAPQSQGGGYQGSSSGGYGGQNGGQGGSGYSGSGGSGYSGGGRSGGSSYPNNRSNGGYKGGGGGRGGFQKPPLTPQELENLKLPKAAVMSGNFKAPEALVPVIREIADLLKRHGFDIRGSNMDGFDQLVSANVSGVEYYIPWKGFNQMDNAFSAFKSEESMEFGKRFLPEWATLKDSHQAFFAKNARLVLGKTCKSPCQLAIVWSEDGVEGPQNRTQQSGHAGHIAAIAHATRIPVINLNNPNAVQRVRQFLGE